MREVVHSSALALCTPVYKNAWINLPVFVNDIDFKAGRTEFPIDTVRTLVILNIELLDSGAWVGPLDFHLKGIYE